MQAEDYDFKLKIGILGDSNVGKSTIFYQYMVFFTQFHEEPPMGPTQGLNLFSKTCEFDNQKYIVQMYDANANNSLVYYRFLPGTDCLLLVFDLSSRNSYNNLKSWGKFLSDLGYNKPLLIVGNKSDKRRRIMRFELRNDLAQYSCRYIEISALAKSNVEMLIEIAISEFRNKLNKTFCKLLKSN